MSNRIWRQFLTLVVLAFLCMGSAPLGAQSSEVMGEVQFSPITDVEKRAGVWIDGQYVGYMKELKGDKKIMLLPGEHEISVRRAGYASFEKVIVVEPRSTNDFPVRMTTNPKAEYPGSDAAELKLDIKPKRAAVFVDNGYVGNAGHFGGFNFMAVSPGTHRIKVELPGYRTFETEINLLPGQKSKVETELIGGSILQAGPLIKEQ